MIERSRRGVVAAIAALIGAVVYSRTADDRFHGDWRFWNDALGSQGPVRGYGDGGYGAGSYGGESNKDDR